MELKYKNKPVFYSPQLDRTYADWDLAKARDQNAIFFGSNFEYACYKILVRLVGLENVHRQVPLLIKPPTEKYPPIYWKCDFRIYHPRQPLEWINVEAKGVLTAEFKRNVQYLEMFSPSEFAKLLVVVRYASQEVDSQITTWQLKWLEKSLKRRGFST